MNATVACSLVSVIRLVGYVKFFTCSSQNYTIYNVIISVLAGPKVNIYGVWGSSQLLIMRLSALRYSNSLSNVFNINAKNTFGRFDDNLLDVSPTKFVTCVTVNYI